MSGLVVFGCQNVFTFLFCFPWRRLGATCLSIGFAFCSRIEAVQMGFPWQVDRWLPTSENLESLLVQLARSRQARSRQCLEKAIAGLGCNPWHQGLRLGTIGILSNHGFGSNIPSKINVFRGTAIVIGFIDIISPLKTVTLTEDCVCGCHSVTRTEDYKMESYKAIEK